MSDESNHVSSLYFLSPKAKGGVLEQTGPAKIAVNTLYLKDALGVRKLDPCRVFVVEAFVHKARLDGEGKVDATRPKGDTTAGFVDRIAVLALVSVGKELIPATYLPVKGMCRPFEKFEAKLAPLSDPAAVTERGEQWVHAASATNVNGRIVLVLTGGQEKGKGKNEFNVGYSQVSAPTEDEVIRYNDFLGSEAHKATATYWAKVIDGIQKKYTEA